MCPAQDVRLEFFGLDWVADALASLVPQSEFGVFIAVQSDQSQRHVVFAGNLRTASATRVRVALRVSVVVFGHVCHHSPLSCHGSGCHDRIKHLFDFGVLTHGDLEPHRQRSRAVVFAAGAAQRAQTLQLLTTQSCKPTPSGQQVKCDCVGTKGLDWVRRRD